MRAPNTDADARPATAPGMASPASPTTSASPRLPHGTWVRTIEGNTSSTDADSQSDGGAVARRARDWEDMCAVIRPVYDDEDEERQAPTRRPTEPATEPSPSTAPSDPSPGHGSAPSWAPGTPHGPTPWRRSSGSSTRRSPPAIPSPADVHRIRAPPPAPGGGALRRTGSGPLSEAPIQRSQWLHYRLHPPFGGPHEQVVAAAESEPSSPGSATARTDS